MVDTLTWESCAGYHLEAAREAVAYYARNDPLRFVIPYTYMGVSHGYEPDYLVRLVNAVMLILEIKGHETPQDQAKQEAAKRWVSAVNNWGKLGRWDFHVCRDVHMLQRELRYLVQQGPPGGA